MKIRFSVTFVLLATFAGLAHASGPSDPLANEAATPPDNYELYRARDAIEARPPISYEEKERRMREDASTRPGPRDDDDD